MMYRLVRTVGGFWLRLFHRLAVVGAENVPADEAAIIVSNHASLLDPLVLGVGSKRRITFVARGTLTEHWLFRMFIRQVKVVTITRDESDREALRAIAKELAAGQLCCIFPEGTRTLDGRLTELKSGFALLAQKAGVKVVPAYVAGTFHVWPKGRWVPRLFGPVGVRFGMPIRFDRRMKRSECTEQVRAALEGLARGDSEEIQCGSALGPEGEISDTRGCDPMARTVSVVEMASSK
ncbi:MAG: lysophospholipid acyltransferase family protein [Planctomycetota bacterium]